MISEEVSPHVGARDDFPGKLGFLQASPCNLCPRLCGADRVHGKRGVCGADDTLPVARAALHFWEEPPLSGESGSGAVFFANCPLHCVYCQNAVIAEGHHGIDVSVDRLAEIFLELQDQGALNINCVTPTHYMLHIRQAVAIARRRGLELPIVWNTSSYERVRAIDALADTVDIYLADFKYASAEPASDYSRAADYPEVALRAIDAMVRTVGQPQFDEYRGQARMTRGVVIRHLLLPGGLDDSKRAVCMLHERYGSDVLVSLMNQYTPVLASAAESGEEHARRTLERFPHLAMPVPDSEYEQLLDYADSLGMEDYFWQEGPAALESFVPEWDGRGVAASVALGAAGDLRNRFLDHMAVDGPAELV
jgi:putative pyruvate formate lyase activating enzyme